MTHRLEPVQCGVAGVAPWPYTTSPHSPLEVGALRDITEIPYTQFHVQGFISDIKLIRMEGIEGVEGVEDICASLGLGHVPLLNAENRELNRRLQQLQVRVFYFLHCL